MKVLQEVTTIESATLVACHYLAGRKLSKHDQSYFDLLSESLGREKMGQIRKNVLAQSPTPDERDSMVRRFQKGEVEIAGWELKDELAVGGVPRTDLALSLIAEHEQKVEQYRREREANNPPKPEGIRCAISKLRNKASS